MGRITAPSSIASFFEERTQPWQELRQFLGRGFPDNLMIDVEISVDEPIAHRHNRCPRYIDRRVAGLRITLLAASPRISMARTRANTNIRSVSKSLRVFPRTKSHTVSAASTIWRSRTRSSGGKLDLGHAFDGLTEVRTEFVCRPQIHRP